MLVKKCCFFVSIKTAVLIFGLSSVLNLFISAYQAKYLNVAIVLAPALAYIELQRSDTKRSRLYFFIAYTGYQLLSQIHHLYLKHGGFQPTFEEDQAVIQACEQIELGSGFENTNFESIDDCLLSN